MANDTTRQPAKRVNDPDRPADEVVKETIESVIIALILAFVFRAYVVEAFVIPTGSMAPTLLGAHASVQCEQCGYRFDVEWPYKPGDRPAQMPARQGHRVICPMCRQPYDIPGGAMPRAGDRILVHKYVYGLTEPRRWDVVVFKAPHLPDQNFIKRLVGLPGESIALLDGNVYVSPDGESWHIARKTDQPEAQAAVWQPLYYSSYLPLDGGRDGQSRRQHLWQVPWVADGDTADLWQIEGRRQYHFDGAGDKAGRITFDFTRSGDALPPSLFPYNQVANGTDGGVETYPIEDIRLAATVRPEVEGVTVRLSTTARLDDPGESRPYHLMAEIDTAGRVSLSKVHPATSAKRTLAEARIQPLSFDHNTAVELWYVDQHACVLVDGQRVVDWAYDLPMDALERRAGPMPVPQVAIEVEGGPVTLERVELDRDLFYASSHPARSETRGGYRRAGRGPAEGRPFQIGPNEYFCLGDNSPMSEDGRFWSSAEPWVIERYFGGHLRAGVVPGELLIGRAFFVYFPAPHPRSQRDHGLGIFPNFGDMRFIH